MGKYGTHRFRENKKRQLHNNPQNYGRAKILELDGGTFNTLYDLIVGRNTVHIFQTADGKFATRLCHAPEADTRTADTIQTADKDAENASFVRRHAKCIHSASEDDGTETSWYGHILNFLKVYRKFYNDAKALPYLHTVFVFNSFAEFVAFKEHKFLYDFQRDNLTSIIVNGAYIPPPEMVMYQGYPTPKSWFGPLPVPLPLSGLQSLIVFYETPEREHPLRARVTSVEAGVQSELSAVLKEFQGGKITNVQVCVTAKQLSRKGYGRSFIQPGIFKGISGMLEDELRAAN